MIQICSTALRPAASWANRRFWPCFRQKQAPDNAYCSALLQVMVNEDLDPAFRAMCCALPGQDEIARALAEQGQTPDPVAIDAAVHQLSEAFGASRP